MTDISIVIVGGGPRALNVLEHLGRCVRRHPAFPLLAIHLIEPGEPGQGCHPASQPGYLLMNTLASQVTAFSPLEMDNPAAGEGGPSLAAWARKAGYRRVGDAYRRGTAGEEIGDLDYLPRALLGEYLTYSWHLLVADLPAGTHVHHHRCRAVDVIATPLTVMLETGAVIHTDYVVFATGHGENRLGPIEARFRDFVEDYQLTSPKLAFVNSIYPVERLRHIRPGAVVAMQGLGLTAYDAISELTVGRGGIFQKKDGKLRYQASGNEPQILLYSRHGLPTAARGVNQKGLTGAYAAQFLTRKNVEKLRATSENGKIDFVKQVLPLLKKEMAYAYRSASLCAAIDPMHFEPTAEESRLIDEIIVPRKMLACPTFVDFKASAIASVAADLAEAQRGNIESPLKAATDAIRDVRDGLAAAIEYAGLSPESHAYLVEHFVPMTNRISFGPPLRRNEELLALIEAGIVGWAGGPGAVAEIDHTQKRFIITSHFPDETICTSADVLILARVPSYRPADDNSPLYRNLLRRGLARPFQNGSYHPHGIDVDRQLRLLCADGTPLQNVWAIGFLTEGARFHTHALLRPLRRSPLAADAALIAYQISAHIKNGCEPVKEIASVHP